MVSRCVPYGVKPSDVAADHPPNGYPRARRSRAGPPDRAQAMNGPAIASTSAFVSGSSKASVPEASP